MGSEKKARSEKAAGTTQAQLSITAPESGDHVLICSNCKQNFDFTVKDQTFYLAKGFSELKRC